MEFRDSAGFALRHVCRIGLCRIEGHPSSGRDKSQPGGDSRTGRYPIASAIFSVRPIRRHSEQGKLNLSLFTVEGPETLYPQPVFHERFHIQQGSERLPEICCNAPYPQNSYNLRAEKGLADFDQRLRWVTSFDYELPFGRGRHYLATNRLLDFAFGGWHLGGIYTLASGFPFSPLLGYDPSNTGDQGIVRANRIANGNLPSGQRDPNLWFNINAFPLPAPYTFGNSGRNVLTGPGVNLLDGSIRKEFATTETQRLEFRAEFFNMLNHPNFSQPDNFIDDGSGAAGVITSLAIPMRQIQFGLKYRF